MKRLSFAIIVGGALALGGPLVMAQQPVDLSVNLSTQPVYAPFSTTPMDYTGLPGLYSSGNVRGGRAFMGRRDFLEDRYFNRSNLSRFYRDTVGVQDIRPDLLYGPGQPYYNPGSMSSRGSTVTNRGIYRADPFGQSASNSLTTPFAVNYSITPQPLPMYRVQGGAQPFSTVVSPVPNYMMAPPTGPNQEQDSLLPGDAPRGFDRLKHPTSQPWVNMYNSELARSGPDGESGNSMSAMALRNQGHFAGQQPGREAQGPAGIRPLDFLRGQTDPAAIQAMRDASQLPPGLSPQPGLLPQPGEVRPAPGSLDPLNPQTQLRLPNMQLGVRSTMLPALLSPPPDAGAETPASGIQIPFTGPLAGPLGQPGRLGLYESVQQQPAGASSFMPDLRSQPSTIPARSARVDEQYYRLALMDMQAGAYLQAGEAFRQMAQSNTARSWEADRGEGLANLLRGDHYTAAYLLQRALVERPEALWNEYRITSLAPRTNDAVAAEQKLLAILKETPSSTTHSFLLAYLRIFQGNTADTEPLLQAAAKNPSYVAAIKVLRTNALR